MYIVGRILQGLASAIVDVAGLALLRDGMGNDRLGEALGYVGTGQMVGTMAGPPLGGLVNRAGGYYGVCILGFVTVVVDAVMRLAVREKKGGGHDAAEGQEGVDAIGAEESDNKPPTTASNAHAESDPQGTKTGSFAGLKLLTQPRVVITLWALCMDGLIIGAFDAVSDAHPASWRGGLELTLLPPDFTHLCRGTVRMGRLCSRVALPRHGGAGALRAFVR